jgi:hypothetical protein
MKVFGKPEDKIGSNIVSFPLTAMRGLRSDNTRGDCGISRITLGQFRGKICKSVQFGK